MKQSACRTCGAPIFWITTVPKGKKMPLDWEAVPGGKWVLEGDEEHARFIGGAQYAGDRYSSHFETCPDAAQHSKSKTR